MLLATDDQKAIGIMRISQIKRDLFAHRKNVAQEAFDKSPGHIRRTVCFHAGLKGRHINMKFSEMSYSERKQIVWALNDLIDLSKTLPRFISDDDCELNSN
ncbi:hypothetical protein [Serratia quinivorans]|uniref:hypothetical protein n=1 Tax=Serratia quinivorans TaxID=137545 RepID=UPI0021B75342|nr:hypothetical protein [Serratia quinivorans]